MGKEIERKFLLKPGYEIESILYTDKIVIKDKYLNKYLRIRNKNNESYWTITLKSEGNIEREEIELQINTEPVLFKEELSLNKTRIIIPYKGQKFEVNIFNDINYENIPLVLIEIELPSIDTRVDLPEWVGEEVTYDERFYGFNLHNLLKYKFFSVK